MDETYQPLTKLVLIKKVQGLDQKTKRVYRQTVWKINFPKINFPKFHNIKKENIRNKLGLSCAKLRASLDF